MIASIYLREISPLNLLVEVDLEVVPRGIYEIDGKPYQYTGQPKFIIQDRILVGVEFTVEPVDGNHDGK